MKTTTPSDTSGANAETLRARYDELIAERERLPELRKDALRTGDQDEFFQVEQRMMLIDDEILETHGELLAAQLEEAWTEIEEAAAHADELQSVASQRLADVLDLRGQMAHRHVSTPDRLAHEAEVAKAEEAHREAKSAHAKAEQQLARLLLEIEDLEARYRATTGREAPAGDGVRARPGVAQMSLYAEHPVTRQTVVALKGTRPPRWIARQYRDNPKIWTAPPDPAERRPAAFQNREDAE